MSIQYKNAGFDLTTTNMTTCLTMDAGSRAIIQNFQCASLFRLDLYLEYAFYFSASSLHANTHHSLVSANALVFSKLG